MLARTTVRLVSGSIVVTASAIALLLGACSSSTPISSTVDSGVKDSGSGIDSGLKDSGAGTDAGAGDAGGGADCAAPNGIYATPDAGPYCPFQQAADGGMLFGSCGLGAHCCVNPVDGGPSTCNAASTACANLKATDFQCNEAQDCAGGEVCCLVGSVKQDQTCTDLFYGSKVNGTKCEATQCASGEVELCNGTDAGACGQGLTCRPFKTKAISLGGCVP